MKFLLLVALAIAAVAVTAEESHILKNYVAGQTQFTANVYKELLKSKSGNFLVSPTSVNVILALVHNGAKGRTAQQLAAGLQLPENKEEIQQIFREVLPHLEGNDKYNLTSANKVYLKNGFEITKEFKNAAVDVFNSEIQNIDFTKKEQAAAVINEWVEQKTYSKIKDLVDKKSFDNDTRAVLVNALYFEGKWLKPFNPRSTAKKTFYVNNKNQVEIDMMQQTERFNYYECFELKAKFLEMPYQGDEVTMTIVLPNDIEGLSALEARIADVLVAPKYEKDKVHVVVPKFTIKTTIGFVPILQSLGIVDAFEDFADFSGILVQPEILKISKVTQKAFIEVKETGTVAAAATAAVVSLGRSGHVYRPPKEFIADHPFIYYLRSPAGILFVGRYVEA